MTIIGKLRAVGLFLVTTKIYIQWNLRLVQLLSLHQDITLKY